MRLLWVAEVSKHGHSWAQERKADLLMDDCSNRGVLVEGRRWRPEEWAKDLSLCTNAFVSVPLLITWNARDIAFWTSLNCAEFVRISKDEGSSYLPVGVTVLLGGYWGSCGRFSSSFGDCDGSDIHNWSWFCLCVFAPQRIIRWLNLRSLLSCETCSFLV